MRGDCKEGKDTGEGKTIQAAEERGSRNNPIIKHAPPGKQPGGIFIWDRGGKGLPIEHEPVNFFLAPGSGSHHIKFKCADVDHFKTKLPAGAQFRRMYPAPPEGLQMLTFYPSRIYSFRDCFCGSGGACWCKGFIYDRDATPGGYIQPQNAPEGRIKPY